MRAYIPMRQPSVKCLKGSQSCPHQVGRVLPRPSQSPPLSTAPQNLGQGALAICHHAHPADFRIVRGKFCTPTSLSNVEKWKDKSSVIFLVPAYLLCLACRHFYFHFPKKLVSTFNGLQLFRGKKIMSPSDLETCQTDLLSASWSLLPPTCFSSSGFS